MQKSSELLGDSQEFMEILTNIQKTLLKSSEGFKFSYETQGDSIKIEVLIQKDSVKQEDDEGWISNIGNNTTAWPGGYGIDSNTKIEIKRRNGETLVTRAGSWFYCWRETDYRRNVIISFRIIK